MTLSWEPNPEEESVSSYVAYVASTEWTSWDAGLPDAQRIADLVCCAHTISGIANERTYWLTVSAINRMGEGPHSSALTARPPGWSGVLQIGTPENELLFGAASIGGGLVVLGQIGVGVERDLFVTRLQADGSIAWTTYVSTAYEDIPAAIVTDASGNTYVSGTTAGAIEQRTNAGLTDAFAAKLDDSGTLDWAAQWGTGGYETSYAMSLDPTDGRLYVTGTTNGVLDGVGAGNYDAFVTQLDTDGQVHWSRQVGSVGQDVAYGVVASAGLVVIAGVASEAFPGETFVGVADAFSVRYDSNGLRYWITQFGTTSDDYAARVSLDGYGNIVVAGNTAGSLEGTNAGSYDVFVAKVELGGSVAGVQQYGSPGADQVRALGRISPGILTMAGKTQALSSAADSFLMHVDSSGALVRAVIQFGGASGTTTVNDLAVDSRANVFIVGGTTGGFENTQNAGLYDGYVVKFDATGAQQ